jgi:hypothetical protein
MLHACATTWPWQRVLLPHRYDRQSAGSISSRATHIRVLLSLLAPTTTLLSTYPMPQGLAVVEFPAPEALTQLCSHALLLQHSHAGDLLVQVLGRRAAAWQALRPGPSSEGVILQSGSSLVQGVNSRGEEGGAKPRTHVVGTASLALSQVCVGLWCMYSKQDATAHIALPDAGLVGCVAGHIHHLTGAPRWR